MALVAIGIVATFFMVGVSAFAIQAQPQEPEQNHRADSVRASHPAATPSRVIG
jgi:hypothetical protein